MQSRVTKIQEKHHPDAGENVPVLAFPWQLTGVSREAAEELIGRNPLRDTVCTVKTRVSRQGLLTNVRVPIKEMLS